MYLQTTEDKSLKIYAKEANYEIFFHEEGKVVAEIIKDRELGMKGAETYESDKDLFIQSLNLSITNKDTLQTAFEKCNIEAKKLLNGKNITDSLICSYTIDFLNEGNFIERVKEYAPDKLNKAHEIMNNLFNGDLKGFKQLLNDGVLPNLTNRSEMLEYISDDMSDNLTILSDIINEKTERNGHNNVFDFITTLEDYGDFVRENPFRINFTTESLEDYERSFSICTKGSDSVALLIAKDDYLWSSEDNILNPKHHGFSEMNTGDEFTFNGIQYPASLEGLKLLEINIYGSDEYKIIYDENYFGFEETEPEPEVKKKNKYKL